MVGISFLYKGVDVVEKHFVKSIAHDLRNAKLPFRLTGAVLFGSKVKNKERVESDLDLLIVADGINPKHHRRGDDIALIKKALPAIPFDILLLTRNETLSNFRNHNPLFLDIAEEGKIVFDEDRFLENLMVETRKYIRERGIQKLDDGWVFPVRPGVPTLLSEISNKDFSLAMLQDGERDFIVGEKLFVETIFDKSVYHFQQAVEKSIKGILIAVGVFKKTHFVGEVLRGYVQEKKFSKNWEKEMLEAAEISESLEPDVSLSRYPAIIEDSLWLPFQEYEEVDAKRAKKKAERVLEIAREFTDEWFSGATGESHNAA